MKEILFKDVVKNYSDNNSIVLLATIVEDNELNEVNDYFHDVKLFPPTLNVVDVFHLSDSVKGNNGRWDTLLVLEGKGVINPIVRIRLRLELGVMWTSDFIDNYKEEYISGENL